MDGEVNRRSAGFTLIELMVVISVLAVLTVSVSLGVNRPRTVQAQDWARFQAVHEGLRSQAVLGREVLGLAVNGEGWRRLRREGGGWAEDGAGAAWRGAVTVQEPFDPRTPLVFLPGGRGTKLRLRFEDGGRAVICESDGWTPVTCRAV